MIRCTSTMMSWLALTLAASLILYHTSDRVNALQRELRTVNADIQNEQQSLHVLRAEWGYLSNPGRVMSQAQKHLNLSAATPRHVSALANMNDMVPMRDGMVPPSLIALAHTESKPAADPALREPPHLAAATALHINDHVNLKPSADGAKNIRAVLGGLNGLRP